MTHGGSCDAPVGMSDQFVEMADGLNSAFFATGGTAFEEMCGVPSVHSTAHNAAAAHPSHVRPHICGERGRRAMAFQCHMCCLRC